MNLKNELMTVIGQLPEEKIPEAILLLKSLLEKTDTATPVPNKLDSLDEFMSVMVSSMSNTMYDLSSDCRRKEEKVMANRLETYRKKLSDGWKNYQDRKQEKKEELKQE